MYFVKSGKKSLPTKSENNTWKQFADTRTCQQIVENLFLRKDPPLGEGNAYALASLITNLIAALST